MPGLLPLAPQTDELGVTGRVQRRAARHSVPLDDISFHLELMRSLRTGVRTDAGSPKPCILHSIL